MKATNMRERVLKKIREGAVKSKMKSDINEPDLKTFVFKHPEESLPETFAREFNKISGKFIYCRDKDDFANQIRQLSQAHKWKNIYVTEEKIHRLLDKTRIPIITDLSNFTNADVSITACEALIARTGSIIVTSSEDSARKLTVFPPIHVVVATVDQLFYDLENAIKFLRQKYPEKFPSIMSIITGPSRTADIEKTLVLGAHGPRDLFCFFINDRS